eukprot:4984860-Amphidinium_carterae.1
MLFCSFIGDLLQRLSSIAGVTPLAFADDITLAIDADDIASLQTKAQQALACASSWCSSHDMELSVDKSEFMLCSLKSTDKTLQPVVCDPYISRASQHRVKGAVLNRGIWDHGKLCIEHESKRYYCMRVRGSQPASDFRWHSNAYYDITVAPLLPVVTTMDILGLRLENTLSYGPMFKKLKDSVTRRKTILSRLQCYSFGPPLSTYRQLARGFVLAPLYYLLPVIFYDMAHTFQLKLAALEAGVCRM